MRTALYHRLSTSDQDPTAARHELRAAATARGYEITMEVEEPGSGARNDRPGLQQVMLAARKRQIDAVLVWKLDRFGRSMIDLLAQVRELAGAGVRFEAITQGLTIDPRRHDSTATLLLGVLAACSEFEREMIRERTLLGLERARRAGKRLGRPPRVLDPIQIENLLAQGVSWRKLAAALRGSVVTATRVGVSEKGPLKGVPKPASLRGRERVSEKDHFGAPRSPAHLIPFNCSSVDPCRAPPPADVMPTDT